MLFPKDEEFKFESAAQEKGCGALQQWFKRIDPSFRVTYTPFLICAWFIQKDHEAQEWFNKRLGECQSDTLNELSRVYSRIDQLEKRISHLEDKVL